MPIMIPTTSGTKRHLSSAVEEAEVSDTIDPTSGIGDRICYGAVSSSEFRPIEAFLIT